MFPRAEGPEEQCPVDTVHLEVSPLGVSVPTAEKTLYTSVTCPQLCVYIYKYTRIAQSEHNVGLSPFATVEGVAN